VDQHAIAGALAAKRRGLRWATLISSSMELGRPFQHLPKIETWIDGLLAGLAAGAGLPAGDTRGLLFSRRLVVAFTTTALAGELSLPGPAALVGPALSGRAQAIGFPWDWLDPARKHVLVTVGTMAEDVASESTDFYVRAADALRPLGGRVQGILLAPPEAVPDPPAHVLVVPRIPQVELMPRLDAVVCHGGLNTVSEALSCGVPLVIAPLTRDQPINAANVARAGAGIRVRFHRVRPDELRAALSEVLERPGYRAAAARIGESFAAAGGAAAAARHLERLALAPAGQEVAHAG
jgi:EryCIII-like glycosyltransferase